jgi:hypothetical protein
LAGQVVLASRYGEDLGVHDAWEEGCDRLGGTVDDRLAAPRRLKPVLPPPHYHGWQRTLCGRWGLLGRRRSGVLNGQNLLGTRGSRRSTMGPWDQQAYPGWSQASGKPP